MKKSAALLTAGLFLAGPSLGAGCSTSNKISHDVIGERLGVKPTEAKWEEMRKLFAGADVRLLDESMVTLHRVDDANPSAVCKLYRSIKTYPVGSTVEVELLGDTGTATLVFDGQPKDPETLHTTKKLRGLDVAILNPGTDYDGEVTMSIVDANFLIVFEKVKFERSMLEFNIVESTTVAQCPSSVFAK
jgi:hypothetical protein